MYELKTKENDRNVLEFIESMENEKKKEDAYKLLDLFTEASGYKAKMWGTSIIGFGSYHYTYKSGHEGDAALVGFSPRKANFSLYFSPCDKDRKAMLARLGKHKSGKSCVYINKLADVDNKVVKELIHSSIKHLRDLYPQQS